MRDFKRITLLAWLVLGLGGCVTFSARDASPVPLVSQVDLKRFTGDWYVIAHIPTDQDRGAHNAVENYRLDDEGHVITTYTSRAGSFDGPQRSLYPTTTIQPDSGNALWAIRFAWYWPFQYEYRVAHLEPDYSVAIIARSKLDYVWLFSRKPHMSQAQLKRYTQIIASWGYDTSKLEFIPQQWPAETHK